MAGGIKNRAYKLKKLRDKFGDCCGLCGKSLDFTITRDGDPHLVTIDHINSRVLKGSNDFENLQLAHYKCNQAKGRAIEKQLIKEGKLGNPPSNKVNPEFHRNWKVQQVRAEFTHCVLVVHEPYIVTDDNRGKFQWNVGGLGVDERGLADTFTAAKKLAVGKAKELGLL